MKKEWPWVVAFVLGCICVAFGAMWIVYALFVSFVLILAAALFWNRPRKEVVRTPVPIYDEETE